MRRFFNWLKAIFNRGMDKIEDPDIMLDQAKRDMQTALVANREKAVQAISQRNRLQMMLDETTTKSTQLENQATMALQQNKRDLALQFMREKANNDSVIAQLQESLNSATATVEQVKVAIKHQEEEVRKKTAEALAMKAQWKNAQIQNSIAKALEGLTFENQYESSFGAAAERIKSATSEASARNEMMAGSLAGKTMELQDSAMDANAEIELQKLEAKLGMGAASAPAIAAPEEQQISLGGTNNGQLPAPPATPAADAAAQSEAEKQLEELEKRINKPQ